MSKPDLTTLLAFGAIYIIWGSTYVVLRIGIETIPPFLLSSVRFFLASVMLLGWALSKKQALPGKRSILSTAVCGVMMLGGGTVSVAWSEQFIPSGTAAIVVTFVPFWFVLLDKKLWNYYFTNKIILVGLLLGFVGVILLVGLTHTDTAGLNKPGHPAIGIIAILCGGIAWTIGSLYTKYKATEGALFINAGIQMFATSIVCLITSFILGEMRSFSLSQVSFNSLIALLYLATVGSIVAFVSYLYLLHSHPPAQVSTYVYVNPLIAVLLGAFIANEEISFVQVFALLVILLGVLLVNMPKYKMFRRLRKS